MWKQHVMIDHFPLQERMFLSVSNYIFTVIFVAEMTVKVGIKSPKINTLFKNNVHYSLCDSSIPKTIPQTGLYLVKPLYPTCHIHQSDLRGCACLSVIRWSCKHAIRLTNMVVSTPAPDSHYFDDSCMDLVRDKRVKIFYPPPCQVVALGFYSGKDSYLQSTWNVLDGVLVFVSIVDILVFLSSSGGNRILGILRVLRLLRTLRPLRWALCHADYTAPETSQLFSCPLWAFK